MSFNRLVPSDVPQEGVTPREASSSSTDPYPPVPRNSEIGKNIVDKKRDSGVISTREGSPQDSIELGTRRKDETLFTGKVSP